LELVELQPEDAARVLNQGSDAEGAGRGARVESGSKVPDLEQSQLKLLVGLNCSVPQVLGSIRGASKTASRHFKTTAGGWAGNKIVLCWKKKKFPTHEL
jgi:hypothetical protein